MLLFACHAWITASYILLCQRPCCLCLSPPPDQLWGSVADGAPSSNPLSLVCAPGFSSLPAHSCLFTSLQLPTPLHGFVCLLLPPARYPPLFAPLEQGVCFFVRAACYMRRIVFAVAVTPHSCWALRDFLISITTGWSFMRIESHLPLLAFPYPSHVLISCPLTLTLLFSAPNYPLVFTLTQCLFPP